MCKTIKQTVNFKAPPKKVYELLTADIPKKAGKFFSKDGASGIVVDLSPSERIVQAWRRRDFTKGIFSMATFLLAKTKQGGTQLTLIHRGVPKDKIPSVEKNWKTNHWLKMKKLLER